MTRTLCVCGQLVRHHQPADDLGATRIGDVEDGGSLRPVLVADIGVLSLDRDLSAARQLHAGEMADIGGGVRCGTGIGGVKNIGHVLISRWRGGRGRCMREKAIPPKRRQQQRVTVGPGRSDNVVPPRWTKPRIRTTIAASSNPAKVPLHLTSRERAGVIRKIERGALHETEKPFVFGRRGPCTHRPVGCACAGRGTTTSGSRDRQRRHRRCRDRGKRPEAGVWVIAETRDLPVRYIKIVVTDDQGRYVLPDLPQGELRRVGARLWPRRQPQGQERARQTAQPHGRARAG